MKLSFEHDFKAQPEKVWDTMLDPGVLSRILPGVKKFEQVAEDRFESILKVGIPAVKGEYKGTVQITNKNPFDSYIIEAEGKGIQGWAKGAATVNFSFVDGITTLKVTADAQIGGRMAGVGQRMIEGVAKMLADEFFLSFEKELQGEEVTQVGMVTFFFRALGRFFKGIFSAGSKS